MLGQSVTFTLNVGGNLLLVRQSDPGYFSQGGIGLFGSHCLDDCTNTPFKGRRNCLHLAIFGIKKLPEDGGSDFFGLTFAPMLNELINCWHQI